MLAIRARQSSTTVTRPLWPPNSSRIHTRIRPRIISVNSQPQHYRFFSSAPTIPSQAEPDFPITAPPPKPTDTNHEPLQASSELVKDPTQVNILLASAHSLLEGIHSMGLPWWATIFCSTFLVRTIITSPVAIYQQRAVGRMMSLNPVLQAWLHTLKSSVGIDHKIKGRDYASFNAEIQSAYRAKVKELYAAYNCDPRVSFLLPWVQIPLFVTMSLAIRGMAGYPLPFLSESSLPVEPGFATGGALWFPDLTAADTTWIMPVAIGAANLLNVELNGRMLNKTPTRNQLIMRNVFRALAVTMIPIAHQAPMAICLYWLSSASYSVAQNVAFRSGAVRTWLRLPPLPKAPTVSS